LSHSDRGIKADNLDDSFTMNYSPEIETSNNVKNILESGKNDNNKSNIITKLQNVIPSVKKISLKLLKDIFKGLNNLC